VLVLYLFSSRYRVLSTHASSSAGQSTVGWQILSPTCGFNPATISSTFFNSSCRMLKARSYISKASPVYYCSSVTFPTAVSIIGGFHFWLNLVSRCVPLVSLSFIYTYTRHGTKGQSRRDSSNLFKFEADVGNVDLPSSHTLLIKHCKIKLRLRTRIDIAVSNFPPTAPQNTRSFRGGFGLGTIWPNDLWPHVQPIVFITLCILQLVASRGEFSKTFSSNRHCTYRTARKCTGV
jgi:hypothetical protein